MRHYPQIVVGLIFKSSRPSTPSMVWPAAFVVATRLGITPGRYSACTGLFSVVLVRYCQLLAAMSAARSQHAATILCSHALAEAMLVYAATIVRLKCSFHCLILIYLLYVHTFGLQNYSLFLKPPRFKVLLAMILCIFLEKSLSFLPEYV